MITINGNTYDFKFSNRKDAADFIVAVSAAVGKVNPNFIGVTNRAMVNRLLIKAKLNKMARVRKLKLSGLLARALFLSASDLLPEGTYYEC